MSASFPSKRTPDPLTAQTFSAHRSSPAADSELGERLPGLPVLCLSNGVTPLVPRGTYRTGGLFQLQFRYLEVGLVCFIVGV